MPAGGLGARVRLSLGLLPGYGWPRWCGGAAACWLDAESYRPRPCCRAWGPLGLLPGYGRPRACCRGVAVLEPAAGVWLALVALRGHGCLLA